jgi:lipopolysaccharide biosynthesis regulator YciM
MITAEEYQNLSYDEQYMEQFKWMCELDNRRNNGEEINFNREILNRLLIVDKPLVKDSILLTYPDSHTEVYDDAKEIAEKFNIKWQKVNNYAFYNRQLNGITFKKVKQKLFGNEYKIISDK